nr:MogA/MoaB family molybdenum cofactor biosynthesis protein [uncultured Niameybacter sp.]
MKNKYKVGIITASDKGASHEREDLSGQLIKDIVEEFGYSVASYKVLPDEKELLSEEMIRLCDKDFVDLILTTGGTGLSPRDYTPEATLAVAHRLVPGIAEAMRLNSLQFTKRAMLSRGVSVVRGSTLIINLPGSPKAVKENLDYIMPELLHALDILSASASECARK